MTKILVVSDTHGKNSYMHDAIALEHPFDMLIHCGDVEGNLYSILGPDPGYEFHAVRGNCDYSGYPDRLILTVEDKRILVVHGHEHAVRYSNDALFRAASQSSADVILFGHSHMPEIEERYGILAVNPGSLAKPRQQTRRRTYAILTITEGSFPRADIKELPPSVWDV
ncbi:MAG: metallophosphoesterase [Blautia sp.]|nr:metallophosphoesterase [Blautia sp.]